MAKKTAKEKSIRNLWWKNEQNHCCQANIFSNQEFLSRTHKKSRNFSTDWQAISMLCDVIIIIVVALSPYHKPKKYLSVQKWVFVN
jgi:hypothetical protein